MIKNDTIKVSHLNHATEDNEQENLIHVIQNMFELRERSQL